MMSKLPKQDFETVVTDAIIAAELAGWPATTAKDTTWDFGAQHMGAVITYDTATAAVANFRGITVGTKNITVDPARPTFQIYHYVGVV
jgi:hypothetical protein